MPTVPSNNQNSDNSLTGQLLDWLEVSWQRQLAFYIFSLLVMTFLGMVVSKGATLFPIDWKKDLLSPVAFSLVLNAAIGTLINNRKLHKRRVYDYENEGEEHRQALEEYRERNRKLTDETDRLRGISMAYEQLKTEMTMTIRSLKINRQEFYDRLVTSKFAQAFSPFLFRNNAGRHSYTYESHDESEVRKQYLEDLRRFIKSTEHSYFTFQPGLPWFAENYWFFKSFDEAVDVLRVVTFVKPQEVLETARKTNDLKSYVYESGSNTNTVWASKNDCWKLIEKNVKRQSLDLLRNELPFDIEHAILSGDLVVCDNRAVVSFSESKSGRRHKGTIQFHLLNDACSKAIKELTSFFANNLGPVLLSGDQNIGQPIGAFRLKELEDLRTKGASRRYTHKDLRVDLSILGPNADNIRDYLDRHGKPRWVLKANSYGMGAGKIAPYLFNKGFRKFAFESVTESLWAKQTIADELSSQQAHELDDLDLLVMEPIQSDQIGTLLYLDASCFVWNKNQLDLLNSICRATYEGKRKAKVHLKVNLGLNRFGIKPVSNLLSLFEYAVGLENIELAGIAGHHSECLPSQRTKDWQQRFEHEVERCFQWFMRQDFGERTLKFPVVHSRSSGSLPVTAESNLNWQEEFRVGGALYGVFPNKQVREFYKKLDVRRAVTLRGRIEAYVPVEPGETISYGNNLFQSQSPGVIGWVNLGYADGLPPVIQDQIFVEYRNVPCKVVGNVGMNYTAIDITKPFTEEIEFDEQRKQRLEDGYTDSDDDVTVLNSSDLSAEQLAMVCSRPSYSVLTAFGASEKLHKHVGEQ